jgi:hypothetical protein
MIGDLGSRAQASNKQSAASASAVLCHYVIWAGQLDGLQSLRACVVVTRTTVWTITQCSSTGCLVAFTNARLRGSSPAYQVLERWCVVEGSGNVHSLVLHGTRYTGVLPDNVWACVSSGYSIRQQLSCMTG